MINKITSIFILILSFFLFNLKVFSQENYEIYHNISSDNFFKNNNKIYEKIDVNKIDIDLLNANIFHLTNIQRQNNNLSDFTFSNSLYLSSSVHSNQMIANNFFDHINKKNNKFKLLRNRILLYDNSFRAIAENIVENNLLDYKTDKLIYYTEVIDKKIVYYDSYGQKILYLSYNNLAKRLISQWMNSNGHRNNILSSTYNFLGCYCSIDENRVPILIRCTQNFGYK